MSYARALKFRTKISALGVVLLVLAIYMHLFGFENTLDAKFYYSVDQAESLFLSLAPDESQSYKFTEIVDLGFIAIYTYLFYILLEHLCVGTLAKLRLLAFAPGLFDLIETITILQRLRGAVSTTPVWLGIATTFKWITVLFVIVIIVMHVLRNQMNRVRKT